MTTELLPGSLPVPRPKQLENPSGSWAASFHIPTQARMLRHSRRSQSESIGLNFRRGCNQVLVWGKDSQIKTGSRNCQREHTFSEMSCCINFPKLTSHGMTGKKERRLWGKRIPNGANVFFEFRIPIRIGLCAPRNELSKVLRSHRAAVPRKRMHVQRDVRCLTMNLWGHPFEAWETFKWESCVLK
ncbi:uncharacterized protein EI90DRAFT_1534369 [Cantharellus anzutake]|uniref:uncharacterized protein n=1 Tax=Cantharellus anzutake TaxID=1750568 RepID=UPI001906158A|nr:uncharacterized protein EI90DRAFT_1534369 [Cantharellus anzutake]KAF8328549.1 hypothetical protein EI90DRAFT_1534369 [Cantharellus anzutake]